MDFDEVARRFELGALLAEPIGVRGGLSNDLWRLRTEGGVFAVKRMVVNAGRPGFVEAVERAFTIECRAWRAQIPMPEPIPYRGHALTRLEDGSLVRVHRWVPGIPLDGSPLDSVPLDGSPLDSVPLDGSPLDGVPLERPGRDGIPLDGTAGGGRLGAGGRDAGGGRLGAGGRDAGGGRLSAADRDAGGDRLSAGRREAGGTGGRSAADAADAGRLLARIHAAGRPRHGAPPGPPWAGDGWPADVRELARRVGDPPSTLLIVDSHGDLDRKNTLRRPDGTLIALDWDAAGPISAVHEAVAVALDWSDGDPDVFRAAIRAYGRPVPDEPWIFGGWLAAQGGWLDYQAVTDGGGPEVERTLDRVREMAARWAPG